MTCLAAYADDETFLARGLATLCANLELATRWLTNVGMRLSTKANKQACISNQTQDQVAEVIQIVYPTVTVTRKEQWRVTTVSTGDLDRWEAAGGAACGTDANGSGLQEGHGVTVVRITPRSEARRLLGVMVAPDGGSAGAREAMRKAVGACVGALAGLPDGAALSAAAHVGRNLHPIMEYVCPHVSEFSGKDLQAWDQRIGRTLGHKLGGLSPPARAFVLLVAGSKSLEDLYTEARAGGTIFALNEEKGPAGKA